MNLLTASWIPVRVGTTVELATFRRLLCGNETLEIALPRDDLELACLQLLVCLTQVLFPPADLDELDGCIERPLDEAAFDAGIAPFLEWFDLDHPRHPFMQIRGVAAKELTPIQKLLPGLPEGNNHAFFNEVGEVVALSPPLAAIALFNQAMNAPSFGGGFKGGLRGSAPVTTLVAGADLRRTVWRNVLTVENVRAILPSYLPRSLDDRPTWVAPIVAGSTIRAHEVGLLRGLFWQAAHLELVAAPGETPCGVFGGAPGKAYAAFNKEKFNFTFEGIWQHPHSARRFTVRNGLRLEEKTLSFTTEAPAWANFAEMVFHSDTADGEGYEAAAVVRQFAELSLGREPLRLIVGGYRNKQAAIIQRRHEFLSVASGWEQQAALLEKMVAAATFARDAVRKKLYAAAKGNKDKGIKGIGVELSKDANPLFYQRSEDLMLRALQRPEPAALPVLYKNLSALALAIYDDLAKPYAAKPEFIPALAINRHGLKTALTNQFREATP